MKFLLLIYLVVIFQPMSGMGQRTQRRNALPEQKPLAQANQAMCAPNSDKSFDRAALLREFAQVLTKQISQFTGLDPKMLAKTGIPRVENERPVGFFVFDLVDTSNRGTFMEKCVELIDGHIYHVSMVHIPYSFSNLVFLESGRVRFFEALNCQDGKDKLEDALGYITPRISALGDRESVIARIRDYRKYGIYGTTDDAEIRCRFTH